MKILKSSHSAIPSILLSNSSSAIQRCCISSNNSSSRMTQAPAKDRVVILSESPAAAGGPFFTYRRNRSFGNCPVFRNVSRSGGIEHKNTGIPKNLWWPLCSLSRERGQDRNGETVYVSSFSDVGGESLCNQRAARAQLRGDCPLDNRRVQSCVSYISAVRQVLFTAPDNDTVELHSSSLSVDWIIISSSASEISRV